jgi:hypothetical protein
MTDVHIVFNLNGKVRGVFTTREAAQDWINMASFYLMEEAHGTDFTQEDQDRFARRHFSIGQFPVEG